MPYDVTNAYKMFGPDLAGVRGKTVRHKHEIIKLEFVGIPNHDIEMNREVKLMANVMFINQISFVITYGWKIGLIMVEQVPN